ncbi:MAG: tRNA dihydrouridine synthase DusB [Peptostreptococcaceae bacterium]|nr:tRNA dihydrouridine synthase DusB [Peptostreptococcaceae bacterium]
MTKFNTKIGNITFDNPFFLAPLAGVTDEAMRIICKDYGAAMLYTEMISAKGLFYGDRKSKDMINISEGEKPVGIQIFGAEPDIMAEAVKILEPFDAALIDVNMGCPVPKIVKNGEGSALLKQVDLIYDIIEKLVKVTKKPITAKIRMGFGEEDINAVLVAKAIEAGGASAVAVHGRTREQFYSGKANWEIIKKVKEEVNIPVIGNGDVHSAKDGIDMINETGCDFVMVARGALGNPWIFRELIAAYEGDFDIPRPTIEEKKDVMLRHFDLIAINKGERVAVREMRKHLGWYTKGVPNSSSFRNIVNNIDSAQLLREAIKGI